MAKLTILEYPDPRLRTRAVPVAVVDDQVRRLIDDMLETMYAAPGVGLAATQVNVHQRVLVADVSKEQDQPLVFVNPEIIEREGKTEAEEGCLSVPGIFDKLSTRSARIVVRALGAGRAAVRDRSRWPARRLHPARNGSPGGQAVRRLPLGAQAHAHSQEAREGASRPGTGPAAGGSIQGSRHLTAGTAGRRAATIDDRSAAHRFRRYAGICRAGARRAA